MKERAEGPARRRWDSACPRCREELDRHLELWQSQYDDVDHGAGIYRLIFEHYCTHGGPKTPAAGPRGDPAGSCPAPGGPSAPPRNPKEAEGMKEDKTPKDVQHWSHPPHVDPAIGPEPPAGAWIGGEAACRNCMTAAEEIAMRRGFADPISTAQAKKLDLACARCGARIAGGS